MDFFDILGIEATHEIKVIKRAYAAKSKECHPEEHPEEFQILHDAYKAALEWAKEEKPRYDENLFHSTTYEVAKGPQVEYIDKEESADFSTEVHLAESEEFFRFFRACHDIYNDETTRELLLYWKDAFQPVISSKVIQSQEFIVMWYRFLEGHYMFPTKIWKYFESLDGIYFQSKNYEIPRFDYKKNYNALKKSKSDKQRKMIHSYFRWFITGYHFEQDKKTKLPIRILWYLWIWISAASIGECIGMALGVFLDYLRM